MTETHEFALQKKTARAAQAQVRRLACDPAAAHALAVHAPRLGLTAGAVVAGYWPLGDEIDPRPLMAALAGLGCRLALPVVVARATPLHFRAWAEGDTLEAGPHGTAHPPETAPRLRPDVLLVPLLGFDRGGWRLGYGGGYYDRTLESLRENAQVRAIGLAFAAQEMAAVPRDGHDQPLDAIATERELIEPEKA